MDAKALIDSVDLDELMVEAPPLVAWKQGIVDNADDVAKFMYKGGPDIRAAAKRRPAEDRRPEEH